MIDVLNELECSSSRHRSTSTSISFVKSFFSFWGTPCLDRTLLVLSTYRQSHSASEFFYDYRKTPQKCPGTKEAHKKFSVDLVPGHSCKSHWNWSECKKLDIKRKTTSKIMPSYKLTYFDLKAKGKLWIWSLIFSNVHYLFNICHFNQRWINQIDFRSSWKRVCWSASKLWWMATTKKP